MTLVTFGNVLVPTWNRYLVVALGTFEYLEINQCSTIRIEIIIDCETFIACIEFHNFFTAATNMKNIGFSVHDIEFHNSSIYKDPNIFLS